MKRKILIVEDDPKVGLSLKLRLISAGYEVMLACDAPSGMGAAIDHSPDLVLLDISLPGGDGFDVGKIIQSLPSPPPIIFLTASERLDFREKARQLGAIGFFEKPYDAAALLKTIRDALAGVQNTVKVQAKNHNGKTQRSKKSSSQSSKRSSARKSYQKAAKDLTGKAE